MPNLKQKVAKGAVWTLCEKLSCQAVTFVVGMIKRGMGRAFSGYEGGLRPVFRFFKDKAVIIQAWKKAHEYICAHNW